MVLGKLDICVQKNKIRTLSYIIQKKKIISKWTKVLNTKPETVKLLEENIGGNFHDIGLGNDFMVKIPKAQVTKTTTNKWQYIKLQRFYTTKETRKRMNKQPGIG